MFVKILVYVKILVFVKILSQSTRKEEEFKSLEVRRKLIALKKPQTTIMVDKNETNTKEHI